MADNPPVLILGYYKNACDYARLHDLTPGSWICAYDQRSAVRALLGADPRIKVVNVYGASEAWSPEFDEMLRGLRARTADGLG